MLSCGRMPQLLSLCDLLYADARRRCAEGPLVVAVKSQFSHGSTVPIPSRGRPDSASGPRSVYDIDVAEGINWFEACILVRKPYNDPVNAADESYNSTVLPEYI